MDQLRQIAPAILMPFEELDWQEQFLHLGRITDLGTKAQALLDRYDTLQQEANHTLDQMLGERGSAVCIFMIGESGAYIYGHGWGRASHILYHSLGFTPPTRMEKDGQLLTGYVHVPLSEIHLYAADHIFIDYARESSEQDAVDKLFAQESWNTLLRSGKDDCTRLTPICSTDSIHYRLWSNCSISCITSHHIVHAVVIIVVHVQISRLPLCY